MSLELVRETIKVNQVVSQNTTQTVIENDIIVPDVKPDIARILILDGDVYVNNADASQDKALIDGVINYKILYVSDEEEQAVKSINSSNNFTYSLDIPNSRQGMKCKVKGEIEHIEYELLNGRKLNIKSVVKFDGKINDEVEHYIVNDMRGVENIQVLKKRYSLKHYLGRTEDVFKLSEEVELPSGKPSVKEILRSDYKITNQEYKVVDDKVVAKGDLNVFTLYVADDEEQTIQFMENEIPFTQHVDLPGLTEDAIGDIEFKIANAVFEPAEDSDGELRVLKGEVDLNIGFEGYGSKNIEIIADAYSPNSRLTLDKVPLKLEEPVDEGKSQIIVKDTLIIEDDNPNMSEVYNVICRPVISDYSIDNDKVLIEGLIRNNVLYLADNSDQPLFCHIQEIPFKQSIEMKGLRPDMKCELELDMDHSNYSMISSREVELRLVVNASAKAIKLVEVPLIKEATEEALDSKRAESQPSITIYFSQPGDNVWKIAKKYYTTLEEVRKVNNLTEQDNIVAGQQIIIPRRKS